MVAAPVLGQHGCPPGLSASPVGRAMEAILVGRQLLEDINSGAVIDRHASGQAIPFASLAEGTSRSQVPFITRHTEPARGLRRYFSAPASAPTARP
jgi:RNA 3'-terminal phosphate cyclase